MSNKDYYEILGVAKNATNTEIKRAFRKLAMKHHPDRNTHNDENTTKKFQEIQEANEVLSDTEKRSIYDRYGKEGLGNYNKQNSSAGSAFEEAFSNFGFGNFEDIFGGSSSGSRRDSKVAGSDLRYDISLSLEEAVSGKSIDIEFTTFASCKDCNNSGSKNGKRKDCPHCHGAGQIRIKQGFLILQQTCGHCHGKGRIIVNICKKCHGEGRCKTKKSLKVDIPMGVDNNDKICISGEGEAGQLGGKQGDLYVFINVKKHDIFTRDGCDLLCDIPIDFCTLALGGNIEVPTLDGKAKIRIPKETQTGKVFRLRSKGVKSVRNAYIGDMLCRVVIETPVNLNKEQQELLLKLQQSLNNSHQDHSPKSIGFLKKLKIFFDYIAENIKKL